MSERTFDELLSAQLDESLDAEDRERFAQMLRDPALARRFVVSCQMHAMLAWEHGAMPVLESPVSKPRTRSHRLRWAIGLAASVVVCVLIVSSFIPNDQAPAPVAWRERSSAGTLAASHGGRLSVPDLDLELHEGDALRVGGNQLAAGFVQLELDGVELTVESPARFRVASDERVLLEAGRLSARVPTSRKKFQVEAMGAATAEIQPGAETAIEADTEASEFHVFAGNVEVVPAAQDVPLHLTSVTATRVARVGGCRSRQEPVHAHSGRATRLRGSRAVFQSGGLFSHEFECRRRDVDQRRAAVSTRRQHWTGLSGANETSAVRAGSDWFGVAAASSIRSVREISAVSVGERSVDGLRLGQGGESPALGFDREALDEEHRSIPVRTSRQ